MAAAIMDAVTKRYKEKISIINGIDPYSLEPSNGSTSPDNFPKCNLWCIGNYLVFKTSTYTHQDFNAYKSLQAYTQFACGWVHEVYVYKINAWYVVVGKVMHSMRLKEKPLEAWVIAAENGEVQSAHCSCMAGLAEACVHVGAILFYIEDGTNFLNEKSPTDVPAYWTPPTSVKKVGMSPIDEISFSKEKICKNDNKNTALKRKRGTGLSDEEYKDFLEQLSKVQTSTPIAILMTESPFCDKYINSRNKEIDAILTNPEAKYPPRLTDLFREELQNENASKILNIAEKMMIAASLEQCEALEKDTRQQSKSKLWFHYRAGRITASMMKKVCATSVTKPSLSLIKQIAYPERMKFVTTATQWGCSHEKTAKETYSEIMMAAHPQMNMYDSGLFISKKCPYVAATPDGIVSCPCCGKGCLEVKCPYCLRNSTAEDLIANSSFIDETTGALKRDHTYFYQVQTQLFATELDFCDFVAWTENTVIIERILPDPDFWDTILAKANLFFSKVILPELLAKMWTDKARKENSTAKLPILVRINKE